MRQFSWSPILYVGLFKMLQNSFILFIGLFFITKGCYGRRVCETRNGNSEKLFSVSSESPDSSYIGTLDIIGVSYEPQQTISLSIAPNTQMCGSKLCNKWVNFNTNTQTLTLNRKIKEDINTKASLSDIDALEIVINCKSVQFSYQVDILVTIKVEYKDDVELVFLRQPYEVYLSEVTEIGVSVINVTVEDLKLLNLVTYYILQGSLGSKYFEIPNPRRGDIRVKNKFDYEELAEINQTELKLDVEVRYRGKYGVITSQTVVTINVEDADDQAPIFQPDVIKAGVRVNPVYEAYVQQNTKDLTTLDIKPGPIVAIDYDLVVRESIVYSFKGALPSECLNYFSIDHLTGAVSTLKALPAKNMVPKCIFNVQATQKNNANMFSIAKLHVSVVQKLIDLYKPVIISDREAFLDPTNHNDVQFLQTQNNEVFKVVATDKDYDINDQPLFKLQVEPSNLFTILKGGYIAVHARTADLNSDLNIQVIVENLDSTEPNNRFSDITFIRISFKEIVQANKLTRNTTNCISDTTIPTSNDVTGAYVAMGIFIALFLVSLIVIMILFLKLRRYKNSCLEAEKRNFELNQSVGDKFDEFGYNNKAYSVDSVSFANSGKSIVGYKHTVDLTKQYGNVMRLPSIEDDVSHITPLDVNKLKEFTELNNENMHCIVPYGSSTLLQEWENVENSLDFNQIRVENWLSENEEKKCGVGEIKLNTYKPCFVKILTGEYSDKESASDDVKAMRQLLYYKNCDNKNIIKFYGCCVEDDCLYMVSEFVSSRDMRTVLLSSRMLEHSAVISTLSGTQLMNFIIGIASGVEYLHNNNYVHGAISARIIRVNDRLVPKIAECCGRNSQRYRLKSNRWASPEYKYSEKSDVWSWGVAAWEILSLGGLPFSDLEENQVKGFVKRQLQTGGSLFPVTRNTTKRLWVLLQNCWSEDPLDRVSMSEIVLRLNKMKETSNPITVARAPGYHFFPSSSH